MTASIVKELLVYADGQAVDCKQLLLARSSFAPELEIKEVVQSMTVDTSALKCPISNCGILSTTELYTDSVNPDLHYFLPAYELALTQASSPPYQRYAVSLEFADTPGTAWVARLRVGLKGIDKASTSPTVPTDQPLPHTAAVFLQFVVTEKGAGSANVSTRRELKFDEVIQTAQGDAEVILHLYSLAELNTVYQVMSSEAHRCQLVLRCSANLAHRTLSQVFVKRGWSAAIHSGITIALANLELEMLPTPAPDVREVFTNSHIRFDYQSELARIQQTSMVEFGMYPQGEAHLAPEAEITPAWAQHGLPGAEVALPAPDFHGAQGANFVPPEFAPDLLQAFPEVEPEFALPAQPENDLVVNNPDFEFHLKELPVLNLKTHDDFPSLYQQLKVYARCESIEDRFKLPEYFFRDKGNQPAYAQTRATCEQAIPFFLPLTLFGYIYPDYTPAGEVALVRYQMAPDQAIFQDATQPSWFYYLPDEFCLTRKDTRPYAPALQVVFFTLSGQQEAAAGTDGESNYNVSFTFKAVPYLESGRRERALDFIRQNQLVPGNMMAILMPLLPESVRFDLYLPQEGGGLFTAAREDAEIVFTHHIVDSLTLSANAFSEVFNSMRVGGEPFNGMVFAKLPGSNEEYPVPFNGRLDRLRGTMTEQQLAGKSTTDPEAYIVQITNAIESPITLADLVVYLLADPDTDSWLPAALVAGALPLRLQPGEQQCIQVYPSTPLANAWGVRLDRVSTHVEIDFESLWLSVFETLGWGSLTHEVTCSIDAGCFAGADPPEKVVVHFNHGEALCALDAGSLSATVKLTKPVLPYLLRQDEANDYFYQVDTWRDGSVVASSSWQPDDSSTLQIVPPMG